ncbi:MAG TPA: hypothetical protein VGX48_24580 [Pyrinomonadaceae bacterium]|jgi:hypothetical protein|nr:hypothetical protein [Pyrinomonadaceae bacterium]
MKRITSAFLLLAALACCAASAEAQRRRPARPPAPAASPWKEFVSKEGGFSVLLPAEPKLSRQDVDTPLGKIPNYLHMTVTEASAYVVGYGDFPKFSETPEFVGNILDGARDRLLATDASRRLLGERDIVVAGHRGREWLVADAKFLYRAETFMARGRFFQVLLLAPLGVAFNSGRAGANAAGRTAFYEGISKKFFGSFKLLPPYAGGGAGQNLSARAGVIGGVRILNHR